MAFFNITLSKKGILQAKIQVSCKDIHSGKNKLYTKRVYNTENLTKPKFRKFVSKIANEFEEQITSKYKAATTDQRNRILTFKELMSEWKAGIKKTLSINYYERANHLDKLFSEFLEKNHLADRPISEITVRDVQRFLNSFTTYQTKYGTTAKLKKDFPKNTNFRKMERDGIITRFASYNLRHKETAISTETATKICEYLNLNYDEYFENVIGERNYSTETIKGYRRILRALFNEAVRYDWITKNPVCATKIGAVAGNNSLRPVTEKEVFSISELKFFLKKLNELKEEKINQIMPIKIMLLTGLRIGEMCGLRWEDIDLQNKLLHVRRNRLYHRNHGIYEKTPKTKASIRTIPLNDSLVKDLKQYQEWFRLADKDFDERQHIYYLAVNIYRSPLFPSVINHWLRNFEHTWQTKEVSIHGLRHTYCSILLSQNIPIQTVSKYMGHSDPTVTLKVYAHFIPDTQEKVVFALNNIAE